MRPEDVLQRIREIRVLEDPKLKPSPYLKEDYEDEYGVVQPVRLRDYQVRGIMNLLQVPRMVLGDDTGLGKTLEVLSTIGYVWMKEPDVVPVVITKKSALFQWGAEVNKFMRNMEAVTVDGPPHVRAEIYEDFFLDRKPDRKRLIILTYDMLLRDMDEAVIRDRNFKPAKEDKKALREARKAFKAAKDECEEYFGGFKDHFDDRPAAFFSYVKDRMAPSDGTGDPPKAPRNWDKYDEDVLIHMTGLRDVAVEVEAEVERLKDVVAPPLRTHGIYNLVREMLIRDGDSKIMFVLDEVHTLKNYRGKMHKAGARLAAVSERVVGMTATPVKNRLMEFFGLYRVVLPALFPKVTHFQDHYCIVKMQKVSGGRRVPIIVGHSKAQLSRFVDRVEPYYLSRRKHEVAEELPDLVTREIICELSSDQEELYDIAELGLLNKADDADANPAEMLSSMVMVQQACNAPQLLADEEGNPFEGDSSKMDALLDLFGDELVGVKTIVFSRFEKMISLIETRLKEAKVKCVRITGKESKAKDREASKNAFQDMASGIDVILITTAGSESINLQSAEHLIFVDSPWSWGDYVQLTGRMIRIGSVHKMVVATHLVAKRQSGTRTIDDYVIKTLRSKKVLADTVAGEALQGGLQFTESNDAMDIFRMMREAVAGKDGDGVRKAAVAITSAKRKASAPKKAAKKAKPSAPPMPSPPMAVPDLDFSDI